MREPQFQPAEQELMNAFTRVVKQDGLDPVLEPCPEDALLRQIAAGSAKRNDGVLAHIGRCDTCVAKLSALHAQTAERRISTSPLHWPRYATISAIAAVLLMAVVSFWAWQRIWHGSPQHVAKVVDLRNAPILRGPEEPQPVELSRAFVDLSISLPATSNTGNYEVVLTRQAGEETVIASGGAARRQDGNITLAASMDLSKVKPGPYLLGIRQAGSGWSYYPTFVR